MNAVVASAGSSRSARAAIARVAAATSSIGAAVVERHEDVHALGPAGLHRAGQPGVGQRLRGPAGRPATASANVVGPRAGRGRGPGGSGGPSRRRGPASGGTRPPAGWRTTAGCAGRCTARTRPRACEASAHTGTVGTQSGVYFGTFFCMNGAWPRPHPDHRQRPVAQRRAGSGRAPRPGSRPGRAWWPRRRRTAAGRGWSAATPSPRLLGAAHASTLVALSAAAGPNDDRTGAPSGRPISAAQSSGDQVAGPGALQPGGQGGLMAEVAEGPGTIRSHRPVHLVRVADPHSGGTRGRVEVGDGQRVDAAGHLERVPVGDRVEVPDPERALPRVRGVVRVRAGRRSRGSSVTNGPGAVPGGVRAQPRRAARRRRASASSVSALANVVVDQVVYGWKPRHSSSSTPWAPSNTHGPGIQQPRRVRTVHDGHRRPKARKASTHVVDRWRVQRAELGGEPVVAGPRAACAATGPATAVADAAASSGVGEGVRHGLADAHAARPVPVAAAGRSRRGWRRGGTAWRAARRRRR